MVVRVMASLLASAVLALVPTAPCLATYSVRTAERAAQTVYAGTGKVTTRDRETLFRYWRCQRNPGARGFVGWFYRRERRLHRQRVLAASMSYAVASVYDAAGGPIACGGDSYALGVANKSLPCGTRLLVCYRRCVDAVVFDRGPYIAGRSMDLSRAVEYAIGFPDGVATIRYAIR